MVNIAICDDLEPLTDYLKDKIKFAKACESMDLNISTYNTIKDIIDVIISINMNTNLLTINIAIKIPIFEIILKKFKFKELNILANEFVSLVSLLIITPEPFLSIVSLESSKTFFANDICILLKIFLDDTSAHICDIL